MSDDFVTSMFNEDSLNIAKQGQTLLIPLSEIEPNDKNIFAESAIESLAENIEENDLIQELIVIINSDAEGSAKYRIHSGHRRFQALSLLVMNGKSYKYLGQDITGKVPATIYTYKGDLQERISMVATNAHRAMTADERNHIISQCHEMYLELCATTGKPAGREREWIHALTGFSDGNVKKYLQEIIANQKEEVSEKITSNKSTIKKINSMSRYLEDNDFRSADPDELNQIKKRLNNMKNTIDDILTGLEE